MIWLDSLSTLKHHLDRLSNDALDAHATAHLSSMPRNGHFAEETASLNHIAALETTQGQMDGLFSQLPCNCHLEEVAFVGD